MKKWEKVLVLLCFACSAGFGSHVVWHVLGDYGETVVSLPKFAGRILPEEDVHPGTFTLRADWMEVGSWDDSAIMTVERRGNDVVARAWVPDPRTPGTFRYAERVLLEDAISLHQAVSIRHDNSTVTIGRQLIWDNLFPLVILTVAFLLLGFVGYRRHWIME